MIYILLTCCIVESQYQQRKEQYTASINRLKEMTAGLGYQILLVENNGKRSTFLDDFGLPVLYTNNNVGGRNKGLKEMADIFEALDAFGVKNDDFVVKLTGRYLLDHASEFFEVLKAKPESIECMIKFGCYWAPSDQECDDCICVLIGMKAKHIREMNLSDASNGSAVCVEWAWAKAARRLGPEKICKVGKLGLYLFPPEGGHLI